jgi:hypothetical protein
VAHCPQRRGPFLSSTTYPSKVSMHQLGLEVKTKHVEEFTEAAEVVDNVDEDEMIQQEVRNCI